VTVDSAASGGKLGGSGPLAEGRDLTAALVAPKARLRANAVAKESCVFCGGAFVEETFRQVAEAYGCSADDWRLELLVRDGEAVAEGREIFRAEGPARLLLTAERTALNFAQLLSGVASATSQFV